jgi:hypothetical protein
MSFYWPSWQDMLATLPLREQAELAALLEARDRDEQAEDTP